jgi:hypothetical protein
MLIHHTDEFWCAVKDHASTGDLTGEIGPMYFVAFLQDELEYLLFTSRPLRLRRSLRYHHQCRVRIIVLLPV